MRASPTMREHAKDLRHDPTLSEQYLWSWLRNRSFVGFKFRRQVPVGPYVLDFYCASLRLAIEVDGHHHETAWMAEYDGKRDDDLRAHGIEVVRISNELLAKDSRTVEVILVEAIRRRSEELKR